MFPGRYFPTRMFNGRYWAKVGDTVPSITPGQHAMFTLPINYTKFTVPNAPDRKMNVVNFNTDFTVPKD